MANFHSRELKVSGAILMWYITKPDSRLRVNDRENQEKEYYILRVLRDILLLLIIRSAIVCPVIIVDYQRKEAYTAPFDIGPELMLILK